MSEEHNQALDILKCIRDNGPITAEGIVQKTEYIRYLVDEALSLMIVYGLICQSAVTSDEWKDPMYQATRKGSMAGEE